MKLLNTNFLKTTIFVAAVLVVALSTSAFAASGTWASTGNMRSARDGHTATLLPNGKVLVAGGTNNGVALSSAELYNPIAGTWASTGSMHVARTLARSVLLSNGLVLVMGGCVNDCLSATTRSAELFNPSAGTFTATGPMIQAQRHPPYEIVLDWDSSLLCLSSSHRNSAQSHPDRASLCCPGRRSVEWRCGDLELGGVRARVRGQWLFRLSDDTSRNVRG